MVVLVSAAMPLTALAAPGPAARPAARPAPAAARARAARPFVGSEDPVLIHHQSPVVTRGLLDGVFGGGKGGGSSRKGACRACKGTLSVECKGCKGTGRNKKNGNVFERWKCYDCQGFGLVKCPKCGTTGLTPEQRGER